MMTAIPSEYEAFFGYEKDQTFSSIHGRTLTKRHRSCKNPKNGSQGQCTISHSCDFWSILRRF
jgi:hypothetical protein